MIQRIQTLWLLLAAIFAFLGFKFSFYSGAILEPGSPETYVKVTGITSIPLIIVTTAVCERHFFFNRHHAGVGTHLFSIGSQGHQQ